MTLLPPSEEIKKKIKEELYQDPDVTARDIQHLKDWIAKQPHLPQNIDNVWLERFLYGCKYSVERCKKVIDNHYTGRTLYPQYFSVRDPTSTEARLMAERIFRFVLPKYTPEGYRVLLWGLLEAADVSKFDGKLFLRREVLFFSSYLHTEHNPGYIAVFDMRGGTMAHFTALFPHFKSLSFFIQDMLPIRIKQVHLLNAPSLARTIVSALSPFLKDKMKERFHIYDKNIEDIYNYLPKEMLPNDYGGEAGTIKDLNDAWQKRTEGMKDWFQEELEKKTDESKRPKESARNDLFGVDGSFKTLSID